MLGDTEAGPRQLNPQPAERTYLWSARDGSVLLAVS